MTFNYFIKKLSGQAAQSALYKGFTGFFMFISISLLVRYLGETGYGIWVLVFGFFQWGLYFDFGVSNVLKSKIPELLSKKEHHKISSYISESIRVTVIIAVFLLLLFSAIPFLFNLNAVFNIDLDSGFTQQLFFLNGLFFCINFVLSINKSFFIGVLDPKISEKSATITQLVFLVLISASYFFYSDLPATTKLILISLMNGLSTTIINGFYLLLFFKRNPHKIALFGPTNSFVLKDIFNNGIKFMAIQTFMVVIFFSDPYFISSYCSPKEVSIFDVINKLYQLPLLVITSGLASFWPFFAQKFHENDFQWFKAIFKKFQKIFVLIGAALVVFTFVSKYILFYWVGEEISTSIDFILLVMMTLAVLFRIYFTFYANFFNGINKLNSQILIMGITAALKIPLTVFLLKNGYGLYGIFLQLFIFMLLWAIYFKIASSIVLTKKANE